MKRKIRVGRFSLQRLVRSGRYIYARFVRLYSQPEAVARGIAVGLFVGMTPTTPFQMMIAVPLASIIKGNQIMAAVFTWVTNPLTWAPIYGFAYWIGRLLIKAPPLRAMHSDSGFFETWAKAGGSMFLCAMVGGLILGVAVGVVGYYISTPICRILYERRIQKIRRRQLRKNTPDLEINK